MWFIKRMLNFYALGKYLWICSLMCVVVVCRADRLNFDDVPGDAASFLPVAQAFGFVPSLRDWQLSAEWKIAPDYYLYQTRMELLANNSVAIPLVFDRPAETKDDPNFGQVKVFHKGVGIAADLRSLRPDTVRISYQGCSQAGLCYPAQSVTLAIDATGNGRVVVAADEVQSTAAKNTASSEAAANQQVTAASPGNPTPAAVPAQPLESADAIVGFLKTTGFWGMIGTFLVFGIGLSLTPCVLPMVPILSGIIAGQGERLSAWRGFLLALAYVLGMSLSYAIAGICVGYFGASANISAWLQNPWVLSLFAAIFVVLALAMFGFYELQLPSSVMNRLNSFNQRQQGGRFLGVAVMGVLSALVVSPCVSAPLAGALIYISTTGDALLGGAALFALGLGMGVPLLAIGLGGGALVPRAGSWMLAVKSFFGVLLLAVALWLLSRFMPGAVMLALWALLVLGLGIALGAFENTATGLRMFWRTLGVGCVIWASLLLIGAATGATNPLKPLEKCMAPFAGTNTRSTSEIAFVKVTSLAQLQTTLAQARAESKPVMVDYYADWCTACLEMSHTTFADQHIQLLAKNLLAVQVDITENNREATNLLNQFGLFAPPSIVFIGADGRDQKALRVMGYLDASALAQRMERLF